MAFLVKRIGSLILTLLIISVITFIVFQIIPGDPALLIAGTEADPSVVETLRQQLGLNQPIFVRYIHWVISALHGDLGTSIRLSRPVTKLLLERLPVTGTLALLATVFAVVISIPLGIYAALHRRKAGDYGSMLFAQVGISVPPFWAGILFILLFAVKLHWFPPGGFSSWSHGAVSALKSLLLPAVALGLAHAAILTRMVRSSMLESLGQDYIRTARSKGLSEWRVVYKHALKNALIPVITVLGLQIAGLFVGSIVIEQVFALPGVGQLLLMAISYRDFPMVQGIILFVTVIVVVVNFIVDVLYSKLDPRIELK